MTFVALDYQPGDIPGFDDWRLRHILIMQIETFDPMEDVDDLCLLFWLNLTAKHLVAAHSLLGVHLVVVLRWPVLKLKRLTIREEANDAAPLLISEAVYGIVDLECDVYAITMSSNPLLKHLLRLILLIIRLNYLIRWLIPAIPQKLDSIFK